MSEILEDDVWKVINTNGEYILLSRPVLMISQ